MAEYLLIQTKARETMSVSGDHVRYNFNSGKYPYENIFRGDVHDLVSAVEAQRIGTKLRADMGRRRNPPFDLVVFDPLVHTPGVSNNDPRLYSTSGLFCPWKLLWTYED